MRPVSAFIKWALIGLLASTILVFAQARELGGTAAMLQVGESSSLRPVIEESLGEVPLVEGPGHDGQIYFAIALDPSGDTVAELLDHAAYRYRRIAFPLLASAFGALDGTRILMGMVAVVMISTAVSAGSAAALARSRGRSDWWALAVVLNPGVWLSVQLLTADVLAIAAMLVGLLALSSGWRWTALGFAASVLAKDVYLTTPAGLAVSRDRRRWTMALVVGVVLLGWMIWLSLSLGEGFTARGNLDWPGLGIMKASSNWRALDPEEWFYLVFALTSTVAGVAFAVARRTWLRWSILGWCFLALVSSNWVWDFGNNAARAFAPIVILITLAAGQDSGSGTAGAAERSAPGTT